ncbi:MAG: hypothetical protein K2K80_03730 [Clostridia bacterium]|nr:hypothetical protein [Clostridia bacterium]
MEGILLKDDWKKESERWLGIMIFCVLIGVGGALAVYFKAVTDTPLSDAVKLAIFFGVMFLFSLYGYLYCILYKIEVYEDRVIRKSLFGTKEYLIQDLIPYTFKKYSNVSELYEFKSKIYGKTVKIYTRYYEELDAILKAHQTQMIID